jgi:hypothetical protein
MTSLLRMQVENARQRYTNLMGHGRNDITAQIVLEKVRQEIEKLERKIKDEDTTRQDDNTRAS